MAEDRVSGDIDVVRVGQCTWAEFGAVYSIHPDGEDNRAFPEEANFEDDVNIQVLVGAEPSVSSHVPSPRI